MLRRSITALMTDDRKLVAEVERMDNAVDKLHEAVKLYVIKLTRESLDESDGRRAMEIISFAINLEHIGDIIDKNLLELAAKKIQGDRTPNSRTRARPAGQAFHRRVVRSSSSALWARFMTGRRRRSPDSSSGRRSPSATPSGRPRSTIWPACAKGASRASRRARFIWTFCGT